MARAMWLPAWPLYFQNYAKAFNVVSPYLVNSVVFVIGTVSASASCSAPRYLCAMARYPFPGRQFCFLAILALLMIPGILTLITSFVVTVSWA